MDLNIEKRIREFQNQLKMNLPIGSLRYLTDLGKINFFLKTVFRRKCHIETDMENLFESKKKYQQLDCLMQKIFLQIVLLDKKF